MEIEKLKEENEKLKKYIFELKENRKRRGRLFIKFFSGVFFGKKLKSATENLIEETANKEFTKKGISDFVYAIIARLTRIGLIGIFIALLPSIFLILQTRLLSNQNRLIGIQNERVVQQNYLQEAQRRSSLNFLLGNVFDKIDEELKQDSTRKLSDQLIGRIVALSHSMKPYYYLDQDDKLIEEPLSPERGQLLLALVNSRLDSFDYEGIFGMGNFDKSDLRNSSVTGMNCMNFNLAHSEIDGISLQTSTLSVLSDYEIDEGFFNKVDFKLDWMEASIILTNSSIMETTVSSTRKDNSNLKKLDLTGSHVYNSSFSVVNTDTIVLNGTSFDDISRIEILPDQSSFIEIDKLHIYASKELNRNFIEFLRKNKYFDDDLSPYRCSFHMMADSVMSYSFYLK